MGNQHSNGSDSGSVRPSPFGRGGGALGLSRSELDKRCQPSGLYESCAWEDRAIRRLIGDGKAAARLRGSEYRKPESACQECPICFLYYEEINTTNCCNASICTECYLQVRPQKDKQAACPFCNHTKISISVAKKLSETQIQQRYQEDQQVEQARIRARKNSALEEEETTSTTNSDQENEDIVNANNTNNAATKPIPIPSSSNQTQSQSQTQPPPSPTKTNRSRSGSTSGFGSSLEQDSRVALFRARSESIASSGGEPNEEDAAKEASMIQSIAMTPEERRRLEEEMRSQNYHPLTLQVEAEARQRRMQNEQAYNRSNPESNLRRELRHSSADVFGRTRRRRGRGQSSSARDWNQIVDAFERGGNGAIHSLDDLVVLEAAILLSMEQEAHQTTSTTSSTSSSNHNNNNNNNSTTEGEEDFDVARHARDGFPLVRNLLRERGLDQDVEANQTVRNLARSLQAGRRRAATRNSMPDTTRDTAAMLMRGITEEEQVAMAIAASLQDANSTNTDNDNDDSGNDNSTEQGETESNPVGEGSTVEASSETSTTTSPQGAEATGTTTLEESTPSNNETTDLEEETNPSQTQTASVSTGSLEETTQPEEEADVSGPTNETEEEADETAPDSAVDLVDVIAIEE